MCVADMVDHGQKIVFEAKDGKDVSRLIDNNTGHVTALRRRNNVYELDLHVMAPGFHRQRSRA